MSKEAKGHRRRAQEGVDPKILPPEAEATTAAQRMLNSCSKIIEKCQIKEAKEWFCRSLFTIEGFIPSAWWSVSQSYPGLFFMSSHKVVQDFFVVAAVPLWLHIEVAAADICWWQKEHNFFFFFSFHYTTSSAADARQTAWSLLHPVQP